MKAKNDGPIDTDHALPVQLPGLDRLWSVTTGSPHVCVAVIDGPIDRDHQCLRAARIRTVYAGVPDGPVSEHGTFVASLLFGRHGSGVDGLVPDCPGLSIPVFRETSDGSLGCSITDLARAITQAADHGARVINISGGHLSDSDAHPILSRAIDFAVSCGAVLVAAAGNEGCDYVHVPASVPSVIAVGALGADGLPTPFSNRSARYEGHILHAPGTGIAGAKAGGTTVTRSSTSAATAIVSGLLALVMSAQVRAGLEPDALEARRLLFHTARGLPDPARGELAVDVLSVLRELQTRGTRTTMFTEIDGAGDAGAVPTIPDYAQVRASDCSCGGAPAAAPAAESCRCGPKTRERSLVYAIGRIEYDFESEARRDSIAQLTGVNPNDPRQLLQAMEKVPPIAESVSWLLSIDGTPLYAIRPEGAFAAIGFQRLRQFLAEQLDQGVQAVSLPGKIARGQMRVRCDRAYPIVIPDIRGMFSWSVPALVEEATGGTASPGTAALFRFLERVYYSMRNLGTASQERALNYAVTNVFQVTEVFHGASAEGLALDTITAERSPLCRPESDCWDIVLTFFDPRNRTTTARRQYRLTVDVSDVMPVTIGTIRSWSVY